MTDLSSAAHQTTGFYHSRSYVTFFVVVNKIVNTTSPGFFTAKVPRTPRNLKLGVLGVLAVVQYLLDHYIMSRFCSKWIVKFTFPDAQATGIP
jgi:hypothetical protein